MSVCLWLPGPVACRSSQASFGVRSHIILFIVVIGFGLPHGSGGIMFGVLLYAADVCFRYGYDGVVHTHTRVPVPLTPLVLPAT